MKAAQITTFGHADAIAVVDVDQPTIADDQVLVEVHASSLNPFDTMVREGYLKDNPALTLPFTLGGDIAGVITEVGSGVPNFKAGDKVYGQANKIAGNSGALAEFAGTKAEQLATFPESLSFDEAASLPLVGVSAVQALTEHLDLQKGQKLFVHGGAGGIGSLAVQIAKHLGAYVAATATGDGIDFVKQLGADVVIDYKATEFSTVLKDFDAVFELAGGKEFDKCLEVLKKGGKAVSMNAEPNEALAKEKGVTALTQWTQVTTERLEKLSQLVADGVISAHVDQTYNLDDIQKAFEARESGAIKGKIVIHIKD